MSAPAMNALSPAPVRMTPRIAASSRASSKAVLRSFQVGVIQSVEHLRAIDGHIGDGAFLLVQDVLKRQCCCRWRSSMKMVSVAGVMFASACGTAVAQRVTRRR